MADARQVAVVTGANRGIGLEICRQLARAGVHVVMTSRDVVKGKAAVRALAQQGLDIEFHQLDVTDAASIRALAADVERKYAAADILINNAGVMLDPRGSRLLDLRPATLQRTLETNLIGPLMLCQALLPAMRRKNYGRVVNLSSGLGQLSEMGSGTPAYRISKTALNALTGTLACDLKGENILVNAMSPGWVRTEMGGPSAPRGVDEGADTAVWLALLPDGGPSGGLFRDRKPIPW
jgi:NAD(P)-dependent dehydrogenase (short-subunit alcohol dehydrogenase family)